MPALKSTDARLYRRWVLHCTAGELIGFGGIPVIGGALAFMLTQSLSTEVRAAIIYVVAVAGGFGEGAVLAWFQLRVLGSVFPTLQRRAWLRSTALAAALAWSLGYLTPTLDDIFGIPPAAQIAIWIPAGCIILISIGYAQARVLRDVVARPARWVTSNVLGWLAGLIWTFALPALLPETAPIAVWIGTFVVAGVLMGLTVGLVTGFTLLRLAGERA